MKSYAKRNSAMSNVFRFDPLPEAGQAKGLSLMLDSHSDLIAASSVPDDFQARQYFDDFDKKNQVLIRTHF